MFFLVQKHLGICIQKKLSWVGKCKVYVGLNYICCDLRIWLNYIAKNVPFEPSGSNRQDFAATFFVFTIEKKNIGSYLPDNSARKSDLFGMVSEFTTHVTRSLWITDGTCAISQRWRSLLAPIGKYTPGSTNKSLAGKSSEIFMVWKPGISMANFHGLLLLVSGRVSRLEFQETPKKHTAKKQPLHHFLSLGNTS